MPTGSSKSSRCVSDHMRASPGQELTVQANRRLKTQHDRVQKMAHMRWKLQRALCQYVTDTAVKDFQEMFSEWMDCRKIEVVKMINIKEMADKIDPTFTKSEGNRAAFSKFMKSNFQMKAESKLAEYWTKLWK
ncbi:hypothetical protein CHARACLAT_031541, partial [Characodon lateralis]|nr:hypothetical protein [Characodon lateralis]